MAYQIPLCQHPLRNILSNFAIRQHLLPHLCPSEIAAVLGIFLPADKLKPREVHDYLNICRDIFTDDEFAEIDQLANVGKHCVVFGNDLGRMRARLRQVYRSPFRKVAEQEPLQVWAACALAPIPGPDHVVTTVPDVHGLYGAMLSESNLLPFEWQVSDAQGLHPGDSGQKKGCPVNARPGNPMIQVTGKVAYCNIFRDTHDHHRRPGNTSNRIWLTQQQSTSLITVHRTPQSWTWLQLALTRFPPALLRRRGAPQHTLQYIDVAAAPHRLQHVALDFDWPDPNLPSPSLELCLRPPMSYMPQGMNWPKFTIRVGREDAGGQRWSEVET